MAWELEIHHVGMNGTGDATLIIARNVPAVAGAGPQVRSVLIDGGLGGAGAAIEAYIIAQLGAGGHVDAVINTHYDQDHTNGLTWLLRRPNLFDNTFIYDQGFEGNAGTDATLVRYLMGINGRNNVGAPIAALAGLLNRTRVTSRVQADNLAPIALPAVGGAPAVAAGGVGNVNLPAHWLLSNPAAPQDPMWHGTGGLAPAGAPSMRFIAVNRYVRTAAGGFVGPIGGLGTDPRNEKSLAVEVRFGFFRYYLGGDIETAQENHIQTLLNPNNDTAGRVLAFKCSHHGAATATSDAFVDQLRPKAAFISCGTANHYFHPFVQVLNVLDGYPPAPPLHGPPPPEPPFRPIQHYMTGYQNVGPPPVPYGTDMGMTAGNPVGPGPYRSGHIKLMVTAAQSAVPVQGELYTAVETAVAAALTLPALAGAMGAAAAAPIAAAAAETAMVHGVATTASWVIDQIAGPGTPGSAAAAVAANGAPLPPGHPAMTMALAVTNAAMNAGTVAAAAAGAGAAAGVMYEDGTIDSIEDAVAGAAMAAGMAAGPAITAGTNAAAVPPAPGQFTVRLWWQGFPAGPNYVVGTAR
jgi:hypothetical protein